MKLKVYSLLKLVPKGKVTTYGELAKFTGLHPRTVGVLMKNNKNPNFPCYKVVRSDGSPGGYSAKGGTKTKIKLLRKDGIRAESGKINLKEHLHKFSKS